MNLRSHSERFQPAHILPTVVLKKYFLNIFGGIHLKFQDITLIDNEHNGHCHNNHPYSKG